MNAQEAARILAKDNDSVVVVGITREASGAYSDGILETTRKWNEAQREDKNV